MARSEHKRPRTGWWPLLVWGGDLHLSPGKEEEKQLDEEIRNANLARLDSLVIPALKEGAPLFDSDACRRRGRLGRYPWRGLLRNDPPPFETAVKKASDTGLRVWGQMDIVVGGVMGDESNSLARSRPRWTARNAQGRTSPIGEDREHLFLCPSNREVSRLFCEVAVEISTRFPISALVLDLRQAPWELEGGGTSHCLCFQCQEKAQEELGLDLQEVLEEGTDEVFEEWNEWKCEIWKNLIRTIRTKVWAARPGLPLFVRVMGDRQNPPDEPASEVRTSPTWIDWVRSGLVEMVLLDQCPGTPGEAERLLLDHLPPDDLDCLVLPMFHETPTLGRPENWPHAFERSLPGWGLTQHLADAWSSAILLKPGARHGEASTLPALEVEPLAACVEALFAAEELLGSAPLTGDIRTIRDALLKQGNRLALEPLESILIQLATHITVLDQEMAEGDTDEAPARGWVELARRLLRWHTNLHCQELYLFDAG